MTVHMRGKEPWMKGWTRWPPEIPSQPFCYSVMRKGFTNQLCSGCYSVSFWQSLLSWYCASGLSHLQHAGRGWAERCKLPKSQWSKEWQVQMQFLETGIIVNVQSWHWPEKPASNSEGHSNSGLDCPVYPERSCPNASVWGQNQKVCKSPCCKKSNNWPNQQLLQDPDNLHIHKGGEVWGCLKEKILPCWTQLQKNSKSKYDFTLYYTLASVEIFGYR